MEEMEEMEWTVKCKITTKGLEFFEKMMALWADTEQVEEGLIRDIFKLGLKKAKAQLEEGEEE